jgi:hypothetical protein
MRRLPTTINLTGILALLAMADLVLYRLVYSLFLPNQSTALFPRALSFLAFFCAQLSSLLALILVVSALLRLLRDGSIFPGPMRLPVGTIALFFIFLATMGIFSIFVSPRYLTHLRLSHAFLVLFIAKGIWFKSRPLPARVGITLLALPLVGQALALFLFQIGATWVNPVSLAHWGQAGILLFFVVSPLLFTARPFGRPRLLVGLLTATLVAGSLLLAVISRFDLVQVVTYYGIRLELTGISTWRERTLLSLVILAYTCLSFALVTNLSREGRSRLYGWGLLLIAASGLEITSPKLALFSLCGLLALAIASHREEEPSIEASAQN